MTEERAELKKSTCEKSVDNSGEKAIQKPSRNHLLRTHYQKQHKANMETKNGIKYLSSNEE